MSLTRREGLEPKWSRFAVGISVDRALSQPESGVQVPQVPSLILVRRDGMVVDSWTGRADSAIEKSALKALGKN
jgi:hypothetical protein